MNVINHRSRSVAAEEEAADHIGFETPRSGVATPQPDLHDKRLPGIMSYFGQVRTASFQGFMHSCATTIGQAGTLLLSPAVEQDKAVPGSSTQSSSSLPGGGTRSGPVADSSTLTEVESRGLQPRAAENMSGEGNPYPTPPDSLRSSDGDAGQDLFGDAGKNCHVLSPAPILPLHRKSFSDVSQRKGRRFTMSAPLSGVVTASNVLARHISNPGTPRVTTVPNTPSHSRSSSRTGNTRSGLPTTLEQLKKLTNVLVIKSGPPTPTRALSAAQPSPQVEAKETSPSQEDVAPASGTETPRVPAGAEAPAPKGKLTIKITEARGLKKSREPYVVVVFQRSELISGGPRSFEDDDDAVVAVPGLGPMGLGGVPIQRQGSDSGRPPMAIPMRSRQSSNTSVTDYNTFRTRSARRSFTNPKWDAEAAL
jgi:serine/threonine protein kinase SCH9